MRRVALAVGGDRARVIGRRRARAAARPSSVDALAEDVEQVAVRRLRAVPERAAEIVQEHDRAALAERRRVAPEPHRVAEPDRRRGDRVQRLARLVQRLPRQRHDDRVEAAGERDPAERDRRAGAPRRATTAGGPASTATGVSSRPSSCSVDVADRPGERVDERGAAASGATAVERAGEDG